MDQSIDRAAVIFGNRIRERDYRRACRAKRRYQRQFGDDSDRPCHLAAQPAPAVGKALGVQLLRPAGIPALDLHPNAHEKPLVVGTIRMGFGHYRIALALASCAKARGYTPYLMDLAAFPGTTASKILGRQDKLYSLGSRLSQQFGLFNKVVWEPLNSEGFRKLSYNAGDLKTAELMTAPFKDLPRDVPFISAHAYPAQAAICAGMRNVVNAIPDNWPMALHLAEGSVHTVQTPSAYWGYKMLRGMDGTRPLKPMPAGSLACTGHYVDHEIAAHIADDCAMRIARLETGQPTRYLLSVGGAGAQQELFAAIIQHLAPAVAADRAALLINVGDHANVWNGLVRAFPELGNAVCHFNDFAETARFADDALTGQVHGIHAFYDKEIFSAVYSTNLLMRAADVLITKPSELSFYPVPKVMTKRVGGHEAWGAIRAAEIGDGTYEMETIPEICAMLDCLQNEPELVQFMCINICAAAKAGVYDGGYRAVDLAEG